jgi:hypothetical protein
MVQYKCEQCNKTFYQKSNYNTHLNRKRPCSKLQQNAANLQQNAVKNDEVVANGCKQCQYCNRIFTRMSSLNVHIKDRCKVKREQENQKEELFKELVQEMRKQNDEIKEMKEEIKKLKTENYNYKQVNQTIITQTNNIQNQQNIQINNNNVKILSFGKEDISHITDDVYKRILKKGMGSIPSLIEYIHFNKNKPENHNVYISNIRSNYAMIYEEVNWKLKDQREVLETLFDKIDILEEKFDEFLKDLSEPTVELLKEIFEGKNETPINNEIKKRIKLLLYNKKELPEKTRELVNSQQIQ